MVLEIRMSRGSVGFGRFNLYSLQMLFNMMLTVIKII